MAEQLDLTTPEVVNKVTTNYRVTFLLLDWQLLKIVIHTMSNLGEKKEFTYNGQAASDYMKTLNTGNFSVNSMHKRILQRLSADGLLVGTVSGTPE